MLRSMCKLNLMLLGMKIFLQTHCTSNLMLSRYARLIRQKKTICAGWGEQVQYFLITFWTCQALVEDNACECLANRHIKLSAWKSQLRTAVEYLQLS